MREIFEPAPAIEAGGELVGKRLVVDETVGAGRADGFLVQMLGVQLARLDAGDLCADQRSAIRKILWAILRPTFEMAVMRAQRLEMLLTLVGG